jgi:hypothetical protein
MSLQLSLPQKGKGTKQKRKNARKSLSKKVDYTKINNNNENHKQNARS